jgi:hypothetical protein
MDGWEIEEQWQQGNWSDSASDDGLIMMRRSNKKTSFSRSNLKSNPTNNKTIKRLEPTTLKCKTDFLVVPDPTMPHSIETSFWSKKENLSASPRNEGLRPSEPSKRCLFAQDANDACMSSEPCSAFSLSDPANSTDHKGNVAEHDSYDMETVAPSLGSAGNMSRTESGMLMSHVGGDDPESTEGFSWAVGTVNMAWAIVDGILGIGWSR